MLIVYRGIHELFVTTASNESAFLKEYFEDGGRNVEDFDREKASKTVWIEPNIRLR